MVCLYGKLFVACVARKARIPQESVVTALNHEMAASILMAKITSRFARAFYGIVKHIGEIMREKFPVQS